MAANGYLGGSGNNEGRTTETKVDWTDVYKAFQWSSGTSFADVRSFLASCGWVERTVECSVVRDESFLSLSIHGRASYERLSILANTSRNSVSGTHVRAASLFISHLISHNSQSVSAAPVFGLLTIPFCLMYSHQVAHVSMGHWNLTRTCSLLAALTPLLLATNPDMLKYARTHRLLNTPESSPWRTLRKPPRTQCLASLSSMRSTRSPSSRSQSLTCK